LNKCSYQGECGRCDHPKAKEYFHEWCVGTDCCKHQKPIITASSINEFVSDYKVALIAEDYAEVMEGIGVK